MGQGDEGPGPVPGGEGFQVHHPVLRHHILHVGPGGGDDGDVVNCIVLGRAEAFAAKNNPMASFFDGLGMGLGFTIALTLLGAVREFLGTGKIFNLTILPEEYGMLVFVLAPGAFIALGYLIALVNSFKKA